MTHSDAIRAGEELPMGCPFCGAELVFDVDVSMTGAWLHPATDEDGDDPGEPACIMSAYLVRHRPQSIARWNRRAISSQAARIAELEEALRPFAEAANSLDDFWDDASELWESAAAMSISAGNLRRARSTLLNKLERGSGP